MLVWVVSWGLMTGDANVWSRSRAVTLGLVVAFHVALLWLLITASRSRELAAHTAPVELIPLPVVYRAPVRAVISRPEHLRADLPVNTPPSLGQALSPTSVSATLGHGSVVNWAAEAHRAVKAFEIRRDAPPTDTITSPWDTWWPTPGHRAGDRFKTENGDWIVWIDANCYQVAAWHPNAPPAEDQPRTVCVEPPGNARAR